MELADRRDEPPLLESGFSVAPRFEDFISAGTRSSAPEASSRLSTVGSAALCFAAVATTESLDPGGAENGIAIGAPQSLGAIAGAPLPAGRAVIVAVDRCDTAQVTTDPAGLLLPTGAAPRPTGACVPQVELVPEL